MNDLYVVLGDSDIVYYNENRESSGDEVMNYDDAIYTAKRLNGRLYKLVPIPVKVEDYGVLENLTGWGEK